MYVEGTWYLTIEHWDGRKETLKPIKNRFTIGLAKAIAYMIRNRTTDIMHAFGEGDTLWDVSPPPKPEIFEVKLVNEIYRQPPDNFDFVKAGSGKAQSGDVNTIVDPRRVSADTIVGRVEDNDFFVGQDISITSGTNAGLVRTITAFNQATGEITVNSPFPAPVDSTTEYKITPLVTTQVSNSIQIRTVLPFGNSSSPFNFKDLREEAIFLGNPSSAKDSGFMINAVRYPKIHKDNTIRLERTVTLTFKI